jgi:hypothetical protein
MVQSLHPLADGFACGQRLGAAGEALSTAASSSIPLTEMSLVAMLTAVMKERSTRRGSRQIIGFSLPPELATKVKFEAAQRKIRLRALFEEMWNLYLEAQKTQREDGR